MKFQKKLLTVGLGLAALGLSVESLAFDITANRAVEDNRFYISGATAMTDSMEALLGDATNAQNPCNVDADWNQYVALNSGNTGLPSDVFIWACTARGGAQFNTDLGIAAGTQIEFHKVDTGSGDGVRPFDPAWQPSGANAAYRNINFVDVTAVTHAGATPNCGAYVAGGVQDCSGLTTADTRNVTNGLTMGTSDVEAALFGSVNPAGSATGGSIIWGLPVSVDFRDALQSNQFPTTSNCHPSNVNYDDINAAPYPQPNLAGATITWREAEECQPTLSRAIVTSIYTGKLTFLGNIMNTKGEDLYTSATNANLLPRGGDDQARVCRRREGSGTEASYEAMFMKQRCMTGIANMLTPDVGTLADGADPYANTTCAGAGVGSLTTDASCAASGNAPAGDLFDPNLRTFAGRGTGDVRECLTLHTQNVDNSDQDGYWAVGIFSSENVTNDTRADAVTGYANNLASRRYRHIKVDGYMPSTFNAAMGLYTYFSEYTMQTFLTADFGVNEADPNVMAEARRQLVVTGLSNTLSDPTTLSAINAGAIHSWGQGGIMSPMNASTSPARVYGFADLPLNATDVAANPLIPLNKHPQGLTSVNNCQEPVIEAGAAFTFIAASPVIYNNSNTATDAELNQQ